MAKIRIPYRFEPRPYQVPLLQAMDSGFKRAVQVWHRRAGKEKTDFGGVMVKKAVERVGTYFYVFPELKQGRKILWDGADKDGMRFIDHVPRELMDGEPNNTEMKIRLRGGSLLQVIGSDRIDSVLGTNPIGMVFSEYSLQDPTCWGYFRPMLAENDGWAIFNLTPRGENHAYQLWELAKADPKNWFTQLLTVDDTGAIKKEVLEQERREIIRLYGNDALFLQEYYCSFVVPISGAYYAEQISQAYQDGRVGSVPHDPTLSVDTWWDLGVNDRMSIWFTQSVGAETRVIDYMEGSGMGLPHYIGLCKQKPYIYGSHTAPHDIRVREMGTAKASSRWEIAKDLGFEFYVAPGPGEFTHADGIEAVRGLFPSLRFDAEKCRDGLNALKSYRKVWDESRKTYLNQPYHDWSSNGADAMRYCAASKSKAHRTKTADGAKQSAMDSYARKADARRRGSRMPGLGVLG